MTINADGVFRTAPAADIARRVYAEGGHWACAVDIAGEPFQALFENESSAWEAYHAAADG